MDKEVNSARAVAETPPFSSGLAEDMTVPPGVGGTEAHIADLLARVRLSLDQIHPDPGSLRAQAAVNTPDPLATHPEGPPDLGVGRTPL